MKIMGFISIISILAALCLQGCSGAAESVTRFGAAEKGTKPAAAFSQAGDVGLGEPLAAAVDFLGNIFVADGIPGRIVLMGGGKNRGLEFQAPQSSPGFYPSDVKLQGFFIYAVDEVNRRILRFDKDGAYRDVLLSFDELVAGKRTSPSGMDVDASGRIAVTDTENHRVLIYDTYLSLELVFGSYGSFAGQLNSPGGVSFAQGDILVVADTGNRRIAIFDDGGRFLRTIPSGKMKNPMQKPRRVVMDESGSLFVADPAAGKVFVFGTDGSLIDAIRPEGGKKFRPTDVELDASGRLYVADDGSRSVLVFKVMPY